MGLVPLPVARQIGHIPFNDVSRGQTRSLILRQPSGELTTSVLPNHALPSRPARDLSQVLRWKRQRVRAHSALATHEWAGNSAGTREAVLSCTTFNVLAPIYKRMGAGETVRESSYPDSWQSRNRKILDAILEQGSSVICLQEMWLSNPELVALYDDALGRAGYEVFKLPRPNDRGDGLLTAVKCPGLQVLGNENCTLPNDCGDRVAQFLWLRVPSSGEEKLSAGESPPTDLLVVNTHLLFPHNAQSSYIRLRQVHKILENLENFKSRHGLGPTPVLLCGDLNGTKKGKFYQFLRSQGFQSSYDLANEHPDFDTPWVSHKNHRGAAVGVDYIWILNPSQGKGKPSLGSFTANWRAAVFSLLRRKLSSLGFANERQAFDFLYGAADVSTGSTVLAAEDAGSSTTLAGNGTYGQVPDGTTAGVITLPKFEAAMDKIGQDIGLTKGEMAELLELADVDGNGVVDFQDFKAVIREHSSAIPLGELSPLGSALEAPSLLRTDKGINVRGPLTAECTEVQSTGGGFQVRKAALFPPETGSGVWPHDWALSDHALLTATFLSPAVMF